MAGTAIALYIGSIFLANYLIETYGFITVAPGIKALAGVYAAGLTFPCRDYIQRTIGIRVGVACIVVGAGLSALISPKIALASGVTFLISESLDCLIYTPLRKRFKLAVLVSSVVSAVVDSLIFLALDGIPYRVALAGQIIGKLEVVAVFGLGGSLLINYLLRDDGNESHVPA